MQVTRDLQPVTFCEWRLPEDAYDLGVADVTLSQFTALAQRVGRSGLNVSINASLSDLHKAIAGSMMPLSDLLRVSTTFVLSPERRTDVIVIPYFSFYQPRSGSV